MVKGIVVQFRRGRHRIHEKHYLLDLNLGSRDDAKKMAGKEVEWKSPSGKIIKGKISDAHGNNGLVRAIFEKGLPGQAMTTEIEVKGETPKPVEKTEKPAEKKDEKKEVKEKKDETSNKE
ncbi:MAG: 50S ribosomal protein L35ae [Nanoarchaeota archaeon]|nr:50S ribosomal protein L35ae [Nanoarchaeota archaeon]